MSVFTTVFGVLGGLALFLYGMYILSSSFKKISSSKLKTILVKMTSNPVQGAGLGALTTSVIQSSSIMLVTLIGLINAGLLNLRQAVGVMFGAEVGTTVTAQLISLKIGLYYLPIIALGFALHFFMKKNLLLKNLGSILFGFGILFLGMATMSSQIAPLKESPYVLSLLERFGNTVILGMLAGAFFTAIIQTSSGAIALIIAMSFAGILPLPAALSLMVGANIGTCITGVFASIGSSITAKRLALCHFLFNLTGAILVASLFSYFISLAQATSGDVTRQIANGHTIFNVTMTILLLPFIGVLTRIAERMIPGEVPMIDSGLKYINKGLLNVPGIAIAQTLKETLRMAQIADEMLQDSKNMFFDYNEKMFKSIVEREGSVDELNQLITDFLTEISEQEMSHKDSQTLTIILHSLVDIERVADHAHNLAELSRKVSMKHVPYSATTKQNITEMYVLSCQAYSETICALRNYSMESAQSVLTIENQVNQLHRRLEQTPCEITDKTNAEHAIEASLIYIETINNLERISDHSENIASSVIMGF